MTRRVRGRALVTGAGGFIGRCGVAPLLAAGFEVHAVLSARSPGPAGVARSLPELAGATLHTVDLLDDGAAQSLLEMVAPTHLLHFAWIATPAVYWTSPDNERWLGASRRLLERFVAGGGVRAVTAGTCAEYDWRRADSCREYSTPLIDAALATPYARCKIELSETLRQMNDSGRCSTAVGRIFFQYGPHESRQRLVASVITQLLAGREALCTHGRQVRSFLHVTDVGAAFAALLDSDVEGPVNVGSSERTTLAEVIELIAQRIGRRDLVRLGARPAPDNDPLVLLPDVERLTHEVNWRPHYTLASGLADTIDWWTRQRISSGE